MYLFSAFIPLALLLPNLLFAWLQPREKPREKQGENVILIIVENLGRMGILVIPFFHRISLAGHTGALVLAAMIGSLAAYYYCWFRYFSRGRVYPYLIKPLGLIPVPMALFPVAYMLFAAALLQSWYLLTATLIFSAGHIPISYKEYQLNINNITA